MKIHATASVSVGSVIKYGTVTSSGTVSLGTTIPTDEYIVLLNYNGTYQEASNAGAYGGSGAYVSAKTSTSFTITMSTNVAVSYQVIRIKCIKYGVVTGNSTINLGTTIPGANYLVILNVNGSYDTSGHAGAWGNSGAYISAKTNTSFTITMNKSVSVSYQVISFV